MHTILLILYVTYNLHILVIEVNVCKFLWKFHFNVQAFQTTYISQLAHAQLLKQPIRNKTSQVSYRTEEQGTKFNYSLQGNSRIVFHSTPRINSWGKKRVNFKQWSILRKLLSTFRESVKRQVMLINYQYLWVHYTLILWVPLIDINENHNCGTSGKHSH